MKKFLVSFVAALVASFSAIAPPPAQADSRQIFYYGQQLPSAWLNQMERDLRIAAGAWIQAAMGQNVNGFYANLNVTPVGGALNVQVGPNVAGTVGALFQFGADDPNPIGGPGATALPADATQIYIPGLITSNSAPIGPVTVPSTGNTQVTLLEAQIQPVAMDNKSVNFVSQSGILTAGSANETQKDVVVYQLKAGTPAASGAQPPPADAGWIGIANITVPAGTTVITTAMIQCIYGFNGFQVATQYPAYTQVTTGNLIASANISAGTVTLTSGVTPGHCLQAGSGGVITDAGAGCGTSTSVSTVTGTAPIAVTTGSNPVVSISANPTFNSVSAPSGSNLAINSNAASNGYVGVNAGIANQPNGLRVFPGDGTSSTFAGLTATQLSVGGSTLGSSGGTSAGPFTASGAVSGTSLVLSQLTGNTIGSASTSGIPFIFNNTGSTSGTTLASFQTAGAQKAAVTTAGVGQFSGVGLTGTATNSVTSATTGSAAAFQFNATGGTTGDIADWQVGGTTKASIGNSGLGTFVGVNAGGAITGATTINATGLLTAGSASIPGTLTAGTVSTGGSTMTNGGFTTTATGANPALTVGTSGNQSVMIKWNDNASDAVKVGEFASGTTNCGATVATIVPSVFCITGVGTPVNIGGDNNGNIGVSGNLNVGGALNAVGAAYSGSVSTGPLTINGDVTGVNAHFNGALYSGTCTNAQPGDVCAGRAGGGTGVYYFGTGLGHYLYFDGANFSLAGGNSLSVGGGLRSPNLTIDGIGNFGGTITVAGDVNLTGNVSSGSISTSSITNAGSFNNSGNLTSGGQVFSSSFAIPNGGGSGSTILSSLGGGAVAGIAPTALYVYAPSYGEPFVIDDGGNVGISGNYFAASRRELKTAIKPIGFDALAAVNSAQIMSWCYKVDKDCIAGKKARNIGGMANDLDSHFVNGPDRQSVNLDNEVSITMAAVQQLDKRTRSQYAQVGPTIQRLAVLIASLKRENDRLRARVASIEVERARARAKAAHAHAPPKRSVSK